MLFSSTVFLFIFLPLTLFFYYIADRKFKNYFLLAASLIFYAWGEPKFIFVMLVSIFANYVFGLLADRFREKKAAGRAVIVAMCLWNISIFFVYKYLNFTITQIDRFFGADIPLTKFTLPIGISFFTFQAMSYVIDVYRKNGEVQKNPLSVALYITFFPQLIAGPIVRYETVAREIKDRKETLSDFYKGLKRFVYGLCKKLILSNSMAVVADLSFNANDLSSVSVVGAWLGMLCYTLQIYYDFSGYSDMSIGLGLMFGFHFNENFDHPYASKSVSEFWRRWHISLGTWFRDYVYFPLGGSRVKSRARLVFNLFVVWFLTGVWHGASWNFIFWGLFYFVILTFEKLSGIPKKLTKKPAVFIYRVFTLLCVMFGWVLFRSEGLRRAYQYFRAMFGTYGNPVTDPSVVYNALMYLPLIVICCVLSFPVVRKIRARLDYMFTGLENCVLFGECCLMILLAVTALSYAVCVSYNPFIYFNF